MSFCTLKYGYFLAILIPLYFFVVPKRFQRYVLLMFSIVFYLMYDKKAFVIMAASGAVVYVAARWMGRIKEQKQKKYLLVSAVIAIIGILALLKYNVFLSQIPGLRWLSAIKTGLFDKYSIVLPLGISFYSLAIIGYLIDVYRGKIEAERNYLDFLLFESFFPHILQGPIARYDAFVKQFKETHVFDYTRFCRGLQLMLWGYIKKMVIADRAAIVVNSIYDTYYTVGGTELFVASLLYTLTIFADFSGCVDIARGTAAVFGIDLMDNFKQPYLSVSIQDFWRRWHISLSSWFRDYLYIPLGGNRKGELRRWINVMIVFGVSGIWHGAGWNYLLWGGLHGVYQWAGHALESVRKRCYKWFHISEEGRGAKIIKVFVTFNLVNFAWIFFRVTDVRHACYIIKTIILHPTPGVLFDETLAQFGMSMKGLHVLCMFTLLLIFVELKRYWGGEFYTLRDWVDRQKLPIRWCIYLLGIMAVLIFGIYGTDYNASDFIYMRF